MKKLPVAALVAVLAGATQPVLAACTARTLNGTWVYAYEGADFNTSKTCAAVGLLTFSGSTALSGNTVRVVSERQSCNGSLVTLTGRGTYRLDGNCLGNASINLNSGATARLDFNVDEDAEDLRFALTVGGASYSGNATPRN